MKRKLQKFTALLLALALVSAAPGLAPYHALASVVGKTAVTGGQGGFNAAAAGGATGSGSQQSVSAVSLSLPTASNLAAMTMSVQQVSVAPSVVGAGANASASALSKPVSAKTGSVSADASAGPNGSSTRVQAAPTPAGVLPSASTIGEKTGASSANKNASPIEAARTGKAAASVNENGAAGKAAKSLDEISGQEAVRQAVSGQASVSASALADLYHGDKTRGAQTFAQETAPEAEPSFSAPKDSGLAPASASEKTAGRAAPPVAFIQVEKPAPAKADAARRAEYKALKTELAALEAAAAKPGAQAAEAISGIAPLAAGGAAPQNADLADEIVRVKRRILGLETEYSNLKPWTQRLKDGAAARIAEAKAIWSGFNKSEKAFIIGQAVFLLALSIYLASLPLLVSALTGDAAMTGVARAVHYWVFAGASLFAGTIARRLPMKTILVGASGGRAMLFGSIGILALMGLLPWFAFLILVGVNAAIVSVNHLVDIDTDGARKVFDSDKKIEQAGYLYDMIFYGMMLVVPPLIGLPMDLLDSVAGPGIGAAAGFTAFAAMMFTASFIYLKNVRTIQGPAQKAAAVPSWASRLLSSAASTAQKAFSPAAWRSAVTASRVYRAAAAAAGAARAALSKLRVNHVVGGAMAASGVFFAVTAAGAFWPLMAGALLIGFGVIGMIHWNTVKLIAGRPSVLSRFGVETGVVFMDDAFFNVVIPTFAIDILLVGAFGNGLLLAAGTFGGLLASMLLLKRAQRIQARMGTYQFLSLLTALAAVAFLPSIGLWAVPTLLLALPAVALVKILAHPLRSRMRALLQTQIRNDPQARSQGENIFALMTVFEVFAAGLGGLVFSWLFMNSGPGTAVHGMFGDFAPMKIVTLALAALSPIFIAGLWILRADLPRWKTHAAHTALNLPRGLGWLNWAAPRGWLARRFQSQAEIKERAKLTKNLGVVGYPAVKEIRVSEPVDPNRPTVVILAPPSVHKLPIIKEGGKQSAGDVHLAIDPSWLIQETLPDGRTHILLKKGLFFDAEGQPWIAEYDVPRPVRYFANFFTEGANERTDGNVFERNLDVPQSNSLQLERTTNDKLLTRMWMAAKGVAVPATLAFLMAAHPLRTSAQPDSSKGVVSVAEMTDDLAALEARVAEHLRANKERLGAEVVVKPSGPSWHSSKGVEFFRVDEPGAARRIAEHVAALSKDAQMTPDGAVLIDQRITPPPVYFSGDFVESEEAAKAQVAGDSADFWGLRLNRPIVGHALSRAQVDSGNVSNTMKDVNLGIYAARGPDGKAVASGTMIRAGKWGKPTVGEPGGPNGSYDVEEAAAIIRIEELISMLRSQHGLLKTEAEAAEFRATLDAYAEKALDSIIEYEAGLERKPGEPYQAQTDFVRLDVMLDYKNGKLTPMVIEVNDHDSGGQHFVDHFYPEQEGLISKAWVSGMLARARRDAVKGKRIVVVGAGYEGKRFTFERAKALGIKVVLIDKPGSWAAEYADEYIEIDTLNLPHAEAAAAAKKALAERGLAGSLDGITTFWEDDVPLMALIGEELGLRAMSYAAANAARKKTETRRLMKEAGLPSVRFKHVAMKESLAAAEADLAAAAQEVGFPAILKPASGAEAKLVQEVRSLSELRAAYEKLRLAVAAEAASDGAFKADVGFSVEQLLEGDEVDVDIVMHGGQLSFHSITDNWPTMRPNFKATGSTLPSVLTQRAQNELLDLAVATARAIGLNDGVFHIEMKMTAEGPRLIEANARMGGSYVRDWVLAVWGVDMADEAFMAAAGIPGPVFKPAKPKTHLSGSFIFSDQTGTLSAVDVAGTDDPNAGFHSLRYEHKPGSQINGRADSLERVAMVTTQGRSAKEAAARQESIVPRTRVVVASKKS